MSLGELRLPFFFYPQFKARIWGGDNIRRQLFSGYDVLPSCGESWVLSSVAGSVSEVARGAEAGLSLTMLIEKYGAALMGKHIYQQHGNRCPLLVKFIDAADDLSVQVHPDDRLAAERHGCLGKTELWYVLQASPKARIASGFKETIDKLSYLSKLRSANILSMLHYESARKGDVFFIPSGRIHSTGKGILFAEIQQCSDITYRIYDFERVDERGQARQLHLEESCEALNFEATTKAKTPYVEKSNSAIELVRADAFVVHKIVCQEGGLLRDMRQLDSFVVYLCTEGEVCWKGDGGSVVFRAGDCALVPAQIGRYGLHSASSGTLLEAYVPAPHAGGAEMGRKGLV